MSKEEIIVGLIVTFLISGIIVGMVYSIVLDEKERISIKIDGMVVHLGDILYTKLGHREVQVIKRFCTGRLRCRVLSGRKYRDGLVSKDSHMSELIEVIFEPYELTRKEK